MKSIKKAIAKLDEFFQDRPTRQGVLARQIVGKERAGDAKLAQVLCNESGARTRMDGSIGDSLIDTAWAAWQLMDLGIDALNGGLSRLVAWVLTKFEGGQPLSVPVPLALPSGVVFETAEHATLAARCFGVRVLVRAHQGERPLVAREIEAIATAPQPATLNLSASVLSALALAPPAHRHHLDGLVNRLGTAQNADGGWTGADLFHMLEALVLAGIRPARAVVAKAAPALLALQRDDGAFDAPPNEERALIGMRALLVAAED
jgi:hypothetical protein